MLKAVGFCLLVLTLIQLAALPGAGTVRAQTTLRLDLDDCVKMAVEANTAVIKANYDLDRAGNGVLMSASPLIPSLSLQAQRTTYQTDALRPENLVQTIHAVCLTGGSAFGLAAADGVVSWLEERALGFPVGPADDPAGVVPVVRGSGRGGRRAARRRGRG